MRLIIEECQDIKYTTEEASEGKKRLYIEGIYLQGEIKNKNGRIYPMDILDKEVARYMTEEVDNRTAYGELDHPDKPSINLKHVSHHIVSLKKEGNYYTGKALVASTPMGDVVRGLVSDGAKLGVSSRGMGSIKPVNGTMIIQDDYRLVTAADIVAHPSAQKAYVNGIMEGVEWVWDEKLGYQAIKLAENHRDEIHKNYKQIDESRRLKMWQSWLNSIKQ